MSTHRLYYADAYQTEFDAQVVALREDGWAALDQSAFYPTSGGQPFDTGTLESPDETVRVTNVEVQDGVVWHQTDGPLTVGESVYGRIDWDRRLDHMQQHAADHMLAGAAWQLFGAVTIGLHTGKDVSSIDMDVPSGRTHFTPEEIQDLETLVNRRVQQDDPIRCWFPDEAELAALPLRKKPTVSEHVRVVAMGDYEMVACGGTHPSTTGQIGPVKVLSAVPSRGKLRLSFLSGMRAMRYFQQTAACAQGVAAALSAEVENALPALQRERENAMAEKKALQEQLFQTALGLIRQSVRFIGGAAIYSAALPLGDGGLLVRAAGTLIQSPGTIALLACPGKSGVMLAFARSPELAPDMGMLLRQCGARGGGRPDMAQGSAPSSDVLTAAIAYLQNDLQKE